MVMKNHLQKKNFLGIVFPNNGFQPELRKDKGFFF